MAAPTGPARAAGPLVAAATVTALALWGLGRSSLWLDEAISVGATRELVDTWRGTGGTMALYYLLLAGWTEVAGEGVVAVRFLSVALAAAALGAVWLVARRAFDARVAWAASLVTASSWLVVRYAQEARSYALVLLFTTTAWYGLVRALQAPDDDAGRRWWRLFAVATVVAPLAHGLAVLQFAGQVALLALSDDRHRWFSRLRPVVIATVAVFVVLTVAGAGDVASWIPPMDAEQLGAYVQALTGPGVVPALVLVAAMAAGAAVCVRRRRDLTDPTAKLLALVPIAWGLVPVALLVAASLVRPYLLPRYVVGSAPGLAMLVAFAIVGPDRTWPRWRSVVVGAAVALALVAGQVELHGEPGDDWQGAASFVAGGARPGDGIVLPSPSVRSAFDHAWLQATGPDASAPPAAVPEAFSPVEPLGDLRRFYLIREPETLGAELVDADYQRVWVVDQPGVGFGDGLTPLLAEEAVADHYRVVSRTTYDGDITVALLERRGG